MSILNQNKRACKGLLLPCCSFPSSFKRDKLVAHPVGIFVFLTTMLPLLSRVIASSFQKTFFWFVGAQEEALEKSKTF